MKWIILFLSLILFSCQKEVSKDNIYIQNFTIQDTSWRLLIDKYHSDYLPPMKSLYIKNCTIILDSTYTNKYLSFRIMTYDNKLGFCTGPVIFNDTIVIKEPIIDVDIKNLVNMHDPYLSGTIRVDDSTCRTIDFKMIKFTGYLKITY